MTYLRALAREIRAQVDPRHLPDGDTTLLFDLYALLALVRGQGTTASDVHDAWVTWMLSLNRNHEAMVPYSELTVDVQDEDDPYVDAIRATAARLPAYAASKPKPAGQGAAHALRTCPHGMERTNCAHCSAGRFLPPVKLRRHGR